MKYPPLVAREKYDDYKKNKEYIMDELSAQWKVSLSDLYAEYYEKYKDENKIRKVKEHQRNWIDKYFPTLKVSNVDRKWFSEYMAVIFQ